MVTLMWSFKFSCSHALHLQIHGDKALVFSLLARVPLPTVRQLSAESQRRHAAKAQQMAREDGGDSDDDSDLGGDDGVFTFHGDADSDDGDADEVL
jgi:hypothetical protein